MAVTMNSSILRSAYKSYRIATISSSEEEEKVDEQEKEPEEICAEEDRLELNNDPVSMMRISTSQAV